MKNKKQTLIECCKQILHEYKQDTHECTLDTCHLCLEYIIKNTNCKKCINFHFVDKYNKGALCKDRLCKAMVSEPSYEHYKPIYHNLTKIDKERVVEFYTRVIRWLKGIPEEEFDCDIGLSPRFKHIRNIDKKAYRNNKQPFDL